MTEQTNTNEQLYDVWFNPGEEWFTSNAERLGVKKEDYPMISKRSLTFNEAQDFVKRNTNGIEKLLSEYSITPSGAPFAH